MNFLTAIKVISIASALLIIFPFVFAIANKFYVLDPELLEIRHSTKQHLPKLISDQGELSELKFLFESKKNNDVGTKLNERIRWQNNQNHKKQIEFELTDELLSKLRNWGESWPDKSAESQKFNINFNWMSELYKYDHWDIGKNCPHCPKFDRSSIFAKHVPKPDYSQLLAWAKLRLMHGINQNDITSASAEVRHLARLIYSQEYREPSLKALSMLSLESKAFEFAQRKRISMTRQSAPISSAAIERAKRACWITTHLFDLRIEAQTLSGIFIDDRIQLCKCAALAEGMLVGMTLGSNLRSEVNLETSNAMDKVIAKSKHCRLSNLREEWGQKGFLLAEQHRLFNYRPLIFRQNIALILINKLTSLPWSSYTE